MSSDSAPIEEVVTTKVMEEAASLIGKMVVAQVRLHEAGKSPFKGLHSSLTALFVTEANVKRHLPDIYVQHFGSCRRGKPIQGLWVFIICKSGYARWAHHLAAVITNDSQPL